MHRSVVWNIFRRPALRKSLLQFSSSDLVLKSQVSTISTFRSSYEHIDDVERLDYYRPGEFHPVEIGDRFQERYRVVHKLGYGSYSTIWLIRDEYTAKHVAMKIGTADHGPKEVKVLSRLTASIVDYGDVGIKLISSMTDYFTIDGPNGTHPCLVIATARCNLADAAEAAEYSPFTLSVARSVSARVYREIVFL